MVDGVTQAPGAARHVVVLGAGPAGLTAAYELSRHGIRTTVLERDPRYVGGIARTVECRGYRFDIGGHRFFSKSQEIEDLWTEVLGDEMLVRDRLSRILYRGRYFDYPLRATNAVRGLGIIETARCILSYAVARAHPVREPHTFEEWVCNRFGQRLFRIFFKTYTEKVWGVSTKELSADWAAQRIKGLDLAGAVRHAVFPHRYDEDRTRIITTLIDRFRYPRLGPGQMWERMCDTLQANGHAVTLDRDVIAIRHAGNRVVNVLTRDSSGAIYETAGSHFISTLPIRDLVDRCEPALPAQVREAATLLRYRDFLTVAVIVRRAQVFPDNWIYVHDPDVLVGRIQNFKNWSAAMVADSAMTGLGLEYFCDEGDALWQSSDEELVQRACRELAVLGICQPEEVAWGMVARQSKAYPVYDGAYKQHLAVIRAHLGYHLSNMQLVGRNGMHHYNNQDHSMMTALLAARNIATDGHFDPWKVNTDAVYHEDARPADEDLSGRLVPLRV